MSAGIRRRPEVADAAALAAENEIAEFMVAVRVCDAVVLSLSLLGVVVYGASVVAMRAFGGGCVGEARGSGRKVVSARDGFAERATSGLNALQKALPFRARRSGVDREGERRGAGWIVVLRCGLTGPLRREEIALDVEGARAISASGSREMRIRFERRPLRREESL